MRSPAFAIPIAIALVALAVRAVFAAGVVFPIPEDTAYYVGVARNLLEGRGLVSDALWSYLTPPLVLPRPAFEIWLPLPTLLAAIPMAIAGPSLAAAQLVSVAAGTLVPLLTWRVARDVAEELALPPTRRDTVAAGAGLAAAVSLPLVLHSALPDSTTLFTCLALGTALLVGRMVRAGSAPIRDLVVLGILLGLAALTRNEAIWLALAWAATAWRRLAPPAATGRSAGRPRLVAIAVPALVALGIVAPWAVRNLAVFGTPLPGQALANALFVAGEDVFAWGDPPTLARYLAQGPAAILEAHVEGVVHDAVAVLGVPSFPLGVLGVLGLLRRAGRTAALRPLLVPATLTFLATSLLFPVATRWGTYLHAAGPAHVLLIVGALFLLDELLAAVADRRGWTRPTAWLGPALAVVTAATMSLTLSTFAAQSAEVAARFAAVGDRLGRAGVPVGPAAPPVITDFPIWYAEALRSPALALPNESPASVLDLAGRFGARYLVMTAPEARGRWPQVLGGADPLAGCFVPLPLPAPSAEGTPGDDALRVWRIECG